MGWRPRGLGLWIPWPNGHESLDKVLVQGGFVVVLGGDNYTEILEGVVTGSTGALAAVKVISRDSWTFSRARRWAFFLW